MSDDLDEPEVIQEYEVKVQYYYDINPSHKITDTTTVDATSFGQAHEKACKRWPNSTAIKSKIVL